MKLTPLEIYKVAIRGGFSPDEAVTMTAIALAESGGETGAINSTGEDSRGLWQVNLAVHAEKFAGMDPTDPLDNAKMAYEVSGHGADIGRWTVTHSDKDARYLQFRSVAEQAALEAGHQNPRGSWTPPENYRSDKVGAEGTGDNDSDNAAVPAIDVDTIDPRPIPRGNDSAMETFLEAALAQDGDPYVWGSVASVADDDPDAFDCAELVQWAAGRAGVDVTTGSWLQYLEIKADNETMTVEEALRTPGALLFSFSQEPVPGGGRPSFSHVAISLGDGRTIEARSRRAGVGIFEAGDRFTHAGAISELGTIDDLPPINDPLPFGQDSDGDGLLDSFEKYIGTNPFDVDSDHDGFLDSVELVDHFTDALDADSNIVSNALSNPLESETDASGPDPNGAIPGLESRVDDDLDSGSGYPNSGLAQVSDPTDRFIEAGGLSGIGDAPDLDDFLTQSTFDHELATTPETVSDFDQDSDFSDFDDFDSE